MIHANDYTTTTNDRSMTVRRLKTYTGSQGYVYQYYFVGKRPAAAGRPRRMSTSFDVTSDRKLTYAVSIFLAASGRRRAGPNLTAARSRDSEQYAAVKMRLFRAFDELEEMQAHGANCRSTCHLWKNRWRRWVWNSGVE